MFSERDMRDHHQPGWFINTYQKGWFINISVDSAIDLVKLTKVHNLLHATLVTWS